MPRTPFDARADAELASDRELAARLAAGSDEALELLYFRYAGLVYYVALRWLPPQEACEVVEDLFIGLPYVIHRCAPDGSLGAWLWDLAERNAALRVRTGYERLRLGTAAPIGDSAPLLVSVGAEIATLRQLIDRLPPSLQSVLRTNAQTPRTSDAAASLGLSPDTVLARLRTARAQLYQAWRRHQ